MEKGMEDNQEGLENQDLSSSDASDQQGDVLSSQANQLAASVFEKLQPLIDESVSDGVAKEFQSNKDKRFQKNEDELSRLRQLVEGKGMSFDDAEEVINQEVAMADLQTKLKQVLDGASTEDKGDTETSWADRQATILGQANIDPNDPELLRFRREFKEPAEYIAALPDKVWQMEGRPGGTEAGASGGEGQQVNVDLMAEYQAELAKIPRGQVSKISDLKAAYRKKNLEVW